MRRSLLPLALALLLPAAPVALAAQSSHAASTRPALTRLAWGSVNLLVHADTMAGVHLWAATTSVDPRSRSSAWQRDVSGRFDPAAVERWTEQVAALLHAERFADGDTASLASAVLLARDSSTAGIFRRREGDRLGDRVFLFLAPKRGEPLVIQGETPAALELANALLHAAALSRLAPPDGARDAVPAVDAPIEPIALPSPSYPGVLEAEGMQGEVWAEFVVGADGRVVPESIEALLSDHDLFTESVRRALLRATFRPAMRQGAPVRMPARQRFVFSIR